ncbi:MAG: hypothetical protein H0T60_00870 [Acidobacteria bacterium]|nr:hypothetical protein [Acidobacteriota bacterium]
MSKKDSKADPCDGRKELLEALFGPEDAADDGSAADTLRAHGIDPTKLVAGFKERLKGELKRIHDETGEVSAPLSATLRKVNAYLREDEPEAVDPKSWVAGILAGQAGGRASGVAFSFRNLAEGEVAAEDREIIEGLKAELESEEEQG